jgi:hypothetical protein
MAEFNQDKKSILTLIEQPIDVKLVAIVSSRYNENMEKYGKKISLSPTFDAVITWQQLFQKYSRKEYQSADQKYRK